MKKNRLLQAIAGVFLLACTVSVSLSVAWFHPSANIGGKVGGANNMPIDGATLSSYFAYGDGSSDDPYGIRTPRHLYNLAWLQYLGYFKDTDDNQVQTYFELADNIDMTGWVLPPIGTEDYPFISRFDGQGYVVSNLTVSNDFSDYNMHPGVVAGGFNDSEHKQPHILGMFGVVGNYNNLPEDSYSSATNQLMNTGIYNATIKTSVADSLMGIAAGYVNDDDLTDGYSIMKNIVVDNSRLDNSSNSIAGDTSAYNSSITSNISDYTLVGYTNDVVDVKKATKTLFDVSMGEYKEFNATENGSTNGWGGSINMLNMYDRIVDVRDNYSTNNTTYRWKNNHIIAPGGEKNTADDTITAGSTSLDDNSSYAINIRTANRSTGTNNRIGNYVTGRRTSTDARNFNYLMGGTFNEYNYQKYYHHIGYKITVDGEHFMSATNFANNGGIVSSNEEEAIVWTIPTTGATGIISTTRGSGNANTNNQNYYLQVNGTSLRLRTNQTDATTWTIDRDANGNVRYVYNGYYLNYVNGNWVMTELPVEPTAPTAPIAPIAPTAPNQSDYAGETDEYQISYNGNYLKYTGTGAATFSAGITISDNVWKFTNINGSTTKIYTIINGTNYYVVRPNNNSANATFSTSENNGTTWSRTSDNRFYNRTNNRYYYLRINNNYLYVSRSNQNTLDESQAYAFTITPTNQIYQDLYEADYAQYEADYAQYEADYAQYEVNHTNWTETMNSLHPIEVSYAEVDGPDIDQVYERTEYGMEYTSSDTTFFPLNVVKDDETTHTATTNSLTNYYPKESNTGYVTIGSNYDSSTTQMDRNSSNMRVSRYNAASSSTNGNIKNSFATGDTELSNIKTINANGSVIDVSDSVATNYEKYTESKTALENVLTSDAAVSSGTRYLYGLHFMDGTVSKDHILNADWVSILGEEKTNYDLPVNAIDFNLKETGYINFFAGSYFNEQVNSFFSLHKVERSGNNITNIYEIEEIYRDTSTTLKNHSYVYKLKDNAGNITYSCPYIFDALGNKTSLVEGKDPDATNLSYSDLPSGYVSASSSVFNTSQIKINNSIRNYLYYAYYFEIPMNDGEYCLGSVPGGVGGYLLYLDIGANAAKTQRSIFYERFTLIEKSYSYPNGIALQSLPETYTTGIATIDISEVIDSSDSVCMVIQATAKGEFEINRSSGDVTLKRTQPNKAPPVYAGENISSITEDGSSINIEPSPIETHSYDVKRMQYYDYFVNLDSLTITTITDSKVDGASTYTREITQSVYNGTDPTGENALKETFVYDSSTDQRSSMKIYNTTNGVKFSSSEIVDQSILTIDSSSLSDTIILTLNILQEGDNEYSDTTTLFAVVDATNTDGTYYIFSKYVLEIIPSSGTLTIKVTEYSSGKVIYVGETQITEVNQTITVSATSTNP